MRDITLGQYYPSNGILHRLDPRIKVLLLTGTIVLIFCTFNFFALGVAALLVATSVILSKVPIRLYLKSMKAIIIVILITSLLNLFYGTGDPLWSFWIFKVTKDGIENSIYVTVGIISLVWGRHPYFTMLRKEKNLPYTACFVESWASKWGELATGEEAIWD